MYIQIIAINVICLVLRVSCTELSNLKFPKSFKFGAATSAYQVEGGWNASGNGISYWDYISHNTTLIVDGSTGDVACDSYHKYREDINLLKELKADHYRFSLSWSRILPTGFIYDVNQDGVDYYNNLINGLLEAGIEPWITIFHTDFPLSINHLGGWSNARMAEYLTDLADLVFSLFGDRVKTWLTINEPLILCTLSVEQLEATDNTIPVGVEEYICSYNTLKTHASIYHLYDKKYRKTQRGRISVVLVNQIYIPASNSSADIEAAQRANQFDFGTYGHPLIYGNYPKVVIDVVKNYSAIQGFKKSRLPELTPEEIKYFKGTVDFLAINSYSSYIAQNNNTIVDKNPSVSNDRGVIVTQDPSWGNESAAFFKVYPEGFRIMLNWLKDNYGNPEIVITEQGFADLGQLNDTGRINYYQLYLNEALKAIHEDKVRLTGYTAWGLMDDFEWNSGYTVKFGLFQVDFNSENRTRTAKESSFFYRKVIETKCLVDQCV